jgi:hypothetical protein
MVSGGFEANPAEGLEREAGAISATGELSEPSLAGGETDAAQGSNRASGESRKHRTDGLLQTLLTLQFEGWAGADIGKQDGDLFGSGLR